MSLLPDAESFRRLADGSTRGWTASLARACLRGLSVPYAVAVAARNAAYDAGLLSAAAAPVPVVAVGNLTLGGTGKTPLVAWAVRTLLRHGRTPAIVSRGYGSRPGERGDEAAELAILLPGVAHVADADRRAAARGAAAGGVDVVVLDDGFQHRRLARDLDIVAVDVTDPFGCGHVFPRGLLREPLAGLGRADAVVLTRASTVPPARRDEIRASLESACRGGRPRTWAEADHLPVSLRRFGGASEPLEWLRGRRVFAFAGIGNPAAFRTTLAATGCELAGFRWFADHHAYAADDLDAIAGEAAALGAVAVVTTLKDLVKVRRDEIRGLSVVAVEIAVVLTAGSDALEAALLRAIDRAGVRKVRDPSRGGS